MKKIKELKLEADDSLIRPTQEIAPEEIQDISKLSVEATAASIPDLQVQDLSRRKELISALKELISALKESYKEEESPRSKARKQIDIVL